MKNSNDKAFEKKMKRLEEIVHALDSPDLSLEEGLKLYKEGAACSRFCREELEKARHELEIWEEGEARSLDLADCDEIRNQGDGDD